MRTSPAAEELTYLAITAILISRLRRCVMLRRSSPLHCLAFGLLMTATQVALAIGFAHPASSLAQRYLSLVQHDSYWFANIIDRGYETTVPPIDHKEMEVSNVAFFPAYPLLSGVVKCVTGLGTYVSLLLVAQIAAWGFWTNGDAEYHEAESGERETQQGSAIRLVPMRAAAAPELASEQPG